MPIDSVRLNFTPGSLGLLNVVLALIMFGVALDLDVAKFKDVARAPRAVFVGLASVLVLFPLMTLALVKLLHPPPSVALGMMLVASSPGGNMSNFLTHLARGNTALSITLTAVTTMLAIVTTPLAFGLLASADEGTAALLKSIAIDGRELAWTFAGLVLAPLLAGRALAVFQPRFAARLTRPMRLASIVFFILFVIGALRANWAYFADWVPRVAGFVAVQDTLALLLGYAFTTIAGLPVADRRAVAIECGIRNSGLSLVLIFAFFGGLGGMAITAAWWGVWHVVSGLTLALWWGRQPMTAATGSTA